jgi:ABC-type polysaccharide/polyol phosphate transport system ATPase subunit
MSSVQNDSCIRADSAALSYPRHLGMSIKGYRRGVIGTPPRALKNFSLNILHGDRVGVIGLNGAGKTTLLRLLSGIYQPDTGTITRSGEIRPIIDAGLGFDQYVSGRKNIEMRCKLDGLFNSDAIDNIILDVESFSSLGNKFDDPIYTYSTGMFFRLAFAYATSQVGSCAVIDELIGSGDIEFADRARDRIERFLDSNSTLIMSSHSFPILERHCSSAIYISNGYVTHYPILADAIERYMNDSRK